MATALDQPTRGSQKYVDFDEFIDFHVNKTRAGIRHTDLLTALVTVALVVLTYLLAFVVLDQWVVPGGFGYWPRLLMLGAVAVFVVGWIGWKVVYPYLQRVTSLYAAKQIETSQPELKSSLLTLVDLKRAGRNVPPHIVAAMEKRAALRLSQMDVEQAVDRRPLMRLAYGLLAVVVVICLYTVFSPKPISASILRALIPVSDAPVATRTRIIKVDPGNTSVLARSQLDVTADLAGVIPAEVTLLLTTQDHSLVDEPVALRDTGEGLNRFRGTLAGPNGRGLLQNFTYVIRAGDATSQEFSVVVEQAPYATVEQVVYDYPDYMGLANKTQAGGDIDAWEGTAVTIHAVTNMPVSSATVMKHHSEDTSLKGAEIAMTVQDGTRLSATFPLAFDADGTYEHFYRIIVRTDSGKTDPVPRLYSLKIRRDLPPEIKLLHPTSDVELPSNGALPFAYEASDPDFMLNSVRVLYEYKGQSLDSRTRALYQAPPHRARVQGGDTIDLSQFPVRPGDLLTFWLEARDNKEPSNVTVTPKFNIAITDPATPDEVQQRLQEEQQTAEQRLQEARQPQQEGNDTGESQASDDQPTDPSDEGMTEGDQNADDAAPARADENQTAPRDRTPDRQQDSQSAEQNGEAGDGNSAEQQGEGEGRPQPGAQGSDPSNQEGATPQDGNSESAEGGNEGDARQPSQQRGPNSQPGRRQDGSQPGERAADDEALQRLLDEYKEDVQRERERQQQEGAQPRPDGEAEGASQDDASSSNQSQDGASDNPSGDMPEDGTGSSPQDNQSQSSPRDGNQRDSTQPRDQGDSASRDRTSSSPSESESSPGDSTPGPGQDPGSPMPSEQRPNDGSGNSGRPADATMPPMNDGAGTSPGESRPADNADPDQTRPGTGDDPGTPMPGDNPDAPADRSGMPSQAGTPSDSQDPATRSDENPDNPNPQGMPRETGGSERPNGARPPQGQRPGDASQPGDRGSSTNDRQSERPPARTGNQPDGPDMSEPGEGAREGQRSEQPAAGEQGSSQQASEGTQNGTQQGPGDSTSSPGTQSQSGGEPGMPGDMPGEGSQSQPGGNQPGEGAPNNQGEGGGGDSPTSSEHAPGSDSGQPPADGMPSGEGDMPGSGEQGSGEQGSGEPGSGEQGSGEQGGGGQEGSGQEGSGSGGESGSGQEGSGGSQPGEGTPSGGTRTGSGGSGDGSQAPEGSGGGAGGDLTPEQAELADKRRATELVLKRLQDELQRGEVSDELLKDLGWTEDNLRDFMSRVQQRLADSGQDNSPAAEARRRQFQEMLRGLQTDAESQRRDGARGDRPVEQGFAAPRRPAPSEFRAEEEAYKQRLSRETAPPK